MNEDLTSRIVETLKQLLTLLHEGGETRGASLISDAIGLDHGSDEFWQAVASREIWGGSGSLFDQAFAESKDADPVRKEFDGLMLQLSDLLEESGHANSFVRSANLVLSRLA